MQQLKLQRNFCEARELMTDNELHYLSNKYHKYHPTFSIEILQRACKTIIFACSYHYRHIQVDFECRYIFNDSSHKFEANWSTDDADHKKIFDDIFSNINLSSSNRSLDDQMDFIIDKLTKYFIDLHSNTNDQSRKQTETQRNSSLSSVEIVQYSQSPSTQRRQHRTDWPASGTPSSTKTAITNGCN